MSPTPLSDTFDRPALDPLWQVIQESNVAVVILSDLRICQSNPSACKLLGREGNTLLGKSLAEISPQCQPDGKSSSEYSKLLINPATPCKELGTTWQFARPDGSLLDAEITFHQGLMNDHQGILCMIKGNSDPINKQSDQLLAIEYENRHLKQQLEDFEQKLNEYIEKERTYNQNREIYSLAIEATDLGIYDTKVKDEDLHLKENWMVRLGHDPKSAAEDEAHWEALIHPDDFERATRQFQRAVTGEIDSYTLEYRLRAKDGSWRWIMESSKVIEKYPDGSPPRIVGTHFDITKRKQAEEAEREQRAFTEALSDTAALLNSTLDIHKVLDLILANASRVVPHDGSDIWLTDQSQKKVTLAQRKGSDLRSIKPPSGELPIEAIDVFNQMVRTRTAVIQRIEAEQPDWLQVIGRPVKSFIVTPITFGENLLGFLVLVSTKPSYFTSNHISRLQAFTNQAATAIRNAQLYARAQEVAALEERQRLAREMHDVISQTLFSATIKAEALPYLFDMEQMDLIRENLAELHRLTRGALAEMRTMLMELRPNTIVHTDMTNLLQQLTDGLAGRSTIEVLLTTKGQGLLPPEVQTALFRITQEAINNMVKHARASKVEISYSNKRDAVELNILDDGCGFDPHIIPPERMGVRIMQERADSIRAHLILDSQPGKGTRIHVQWRKVEKSHD